MKAPIHFISSSVFEASPDHDTLIKKVPEETQESRIAPQTAPLAAPNWLRLAYSLEYLIALLASVSLWTEVGGQGHMDLIAWYLKLPFILLQAWCAVRFTAAIVEQTPVWSRRSRLWLAGLILTATSMAAITLYYHLHEVTDETDSEETSASAASQL